VITASNVPPPFRIFVIVTVIGTMSVNSSAVKTMPTPFDGFVTVRLTGPAPRAGADTVSCVASTTETDAAANATLLRLTVDVGAKFAPLTVMVSGAAEPTVTLDGETEEIVGVGIPPALTTRGRAADVPPPPPMTGLDTLTVRLVMADAIADAGMVTASCELLTKTGVSGVLLLLNVTVDAGTKLLPLRLRVKAAPPAITLDGDSDERTGAGLELVTLNTDGGDADWPGLVTVTPTEPAESGKSPAAEPGVTLSVSCVLLTNVAIGAGVGGLGVQLTVAPGTKLLPLMVSRNDGLPAATLTGESEEIAAGPLAALTVNAAAAEVPPAVGAPGLVTVIWTTPTVLGKSPAAAPRVRSTVS
jgi:hypothetical protein